MIRTLLIRADADSLIGTGHVMRCLALAEEWRDRGGAFTFAGSIASGDIAERIRAESGELIPVSRSHPDPGDLAELRALSDCIRPDWIVLDGYRFDPGYQKDLLNAGFRVLVVDDDACWTTYHATALLNQNIGADRLAYRFPRPVQTLFGPRFALLRREFRMRPTTVGGRNEKGLRILVTLGGADPDNVTELVLNAFLRIDRPDFRITAVAGAANPHRDSLRQAFRAFPGTAELLENVSDMAAVMAASDLAVCAAGSTCWELCSMGIPAMTIVLAGNQERIAEGLARAGATVNLGPHSRLTADSLARTIQLYLEDGEWMCRASAAGRELVDGAGASRVVERMRQWREREELRCV